MAGALGRGARAEDVPLQLEIILNGTTVGLIAQFVSRDGTLYAKPSELDQIGLKVPPELRTPDGLVPLAALPGVSAQLNQRNQTLSITAATAALRPYQIGASGRGAAIPLTEAAPGAVLDYDVTSTAISGQTSGAGLFDARAFGLSGVLDSTGVTYTRPASGQTSFVRLDSAWTYADPASLRRYSVGDMINGGLGWTRPIRLGGVQLRTDFGLQPGLITFALPTVTGQAAVPSTADVLINGVKQFSQDVTPGPFQLRQPPVVTGAGTIELAVQDPLGHQTITTLPFYISPDLLDAGRAAYSLELGSTRRNYGYQSDDYTAGVASGTFRYGVLDWLTLETHAEAIGGLEMAGLSAELRTFSLGLLSLAAARSFGQGGSLARGTSGIATGGHGNGTEFSVGFQRQAAPISFGVSATKANDGFRDLAAVTGAPVVRSSFRANVGLALGKFGSLAAAYVQQTGTASTTSLPTPANLGTVLLPIAPSYRVVTVSYTNQLTNRVSLIATAFSSVASGTHSFGGEIGITVTFGPRSSGYAGMTGDNSTSLSGVAQVQQSASQPGEFGYNVLDQEGGFRRRLAQADYVGTWGRATAGVDSAPGYLAGRAELRGAAVAMGGGAFLSNYIDDSFAVVRSGDVPKVGVLYENRPVGQTDSDSRLLVTGLRAWESNTIALDPADLPPDVEAGAVEVHVRPPEKSGVLVPFDVKRSQAAVVVLVDAAGKPLPVGTTVLTNGAQSTVVGYDGETYLQGLAAENEAVATLPGPATCRVRFGYTPAPGTIPRIGPLRCQ